MPKSSTSKILSAIKGKNHLKKSPCAGSEVPTRQDKLEEEPEPEMGNVLSNILGRGNSNKKIPR